MTAGEPLIIVRDLREVVGAGYGNATASVRTLDGVSLEIHSGELLLVDSAVAGGAHALCSAIAAPRRSLTGAREVTPGVRIRRATISHAARDVIVGSWTDGSTPRARPAVQSAARVVYLLRVRPSRAGEHADVSRDAWSNAWRDWAGALRASEGALVLFATAPESALLRPRVSGAVHEPDHSTSRGRVRALRMSAGRVVSEQLISAGSPSLAPTYGDSDASRSPNASSRYSTGSTAPSCRGDAESR